MLKQSLGFFEGPDSPEGLKSSLRRTHLRSSSMPSSQGSELLLHIPPHRKLSSLFFGAAHALVLMLCVVCHLQDAVKTSADCTITRTMSGHACASGWGLGIAALSWTLIVRTHLRL